MSDGPDELPPDAVLAEAALTIIGHGEGRWLPRMVAAMKERGPGCFDLRVWHQRGCAIFNDRMCDCEADCEVIDSTPVQ